MHQHGGKKSGGKVISALEQLIKRLKAQGNPAHKTPSNPEEFVRKCPSYRKGANGGQCHILTFYCQRKFEITGLETTK